MKGKEKERRIEEKKYRGEKICILTERRHSMVSTKKKCTLKKKYTKRGKDINNKQEIQ